MQGDIQLPKPKRDRPAATPKHQPKPTEPDFTVDEPEVIEADPEKPAKKERKLLVPPHKHFVRFWAWWTALNRNERFGIIAVALLIFGAASLAWFVFIQPQSDPSLTIVKHEKPKPVVPTTVASPLTGIQVDPAAAARPVTGIMIENSVFARPQSGLQDAGVVVEAVAEGGITRFLALFQEATPQHVGPVRSLRPYYLDFAAAFQASIAHVGGSPEALARVRNGSYRDIDQFFNSNYYWRSAARAAPHNVYTSFAKLDTLNTSKGYTKSTFTSWPRKPDGKPAVPPPAKNIDIQISSPDYYSKYAYDATTNTYFRSEGGAPHMELTSDSDRTGVQIHPKVVLALVMPYSIAADGQHSVYGDVGSGQAFVFQDGGVTVGTWSKPAADAQISFADSAGKPIALNTGQTWITLVAGADKVKYGP